MLQITALRILIFPNITILQASGVDSSGHLAIVHFFLTY